MGSRPQVSANVDRERLIEAHLPLARAVARRYVGRGEDLDDLIQVAAIGLIKATDRFDPSRGVAFATFATPAIDGEIRRHLRDRTGSVRIPRELQQLGGKLRQCHGELAAALQRSPTVSELAKALAADERDVESALVAERAREWIPISSDHDAVATAEDLEPLVGSDDKLLLTLSVRALEERERRIVFLRFHADMTERQIALELGISQAHVSRLLAGALSKLRADLANSSSLPAERDTTADSVISPESGTTRPLEGTSANSLAGENARKCSSEDTRIAGVGAPHENPTLGRYLDLPYHVALRSEHAGERSWWSATVEELPDCKVQASTPEEALELLRPAMERWVSAALAEHREVPVPNGEVSKQRTGSTHSGRFLVRMPGALHEQLAGAAERENVSLNRFVTQALAASVAPPRPTQQSALEQPPTTALESLPGTQRQPARAVRVALLTNLIVIVLVGLVAVALLVLALMRI